ncbi:MAG: patatin-like phospholipase family protein [Peptococcaceae bacterium]|nr:patatin-like phospholipase family protein [Peptococcaceae bacterium]
MKNSFGLALGGGFIRGTAHIGILKVLAGEKLKPGLVSGTSSGSMVAAFHAAGLAPDQIARLAGSMRASDVYDRESTLRRLAPMVAKAACDFCRLPFPWSTPLGLMSGRALESFIQKNVGNLDMRKLPATIAIPAVDLNGGHRVIFLGGKVIPPARSDSRYITDCPLPLAVKASTAVPGIFEPVAWGGYLLVDGGVMETVPARVLRELGATRILAIDVGYHQGPYGPVHNMVELLERTLDLAGTAQVELETAKFADVVIRPDTSGVGLWDFDRIPRLIEAGAQAAAELMPEIRRLAVARVSVAV